MSTRDDEQVKKWLDFLEKEPKSRDPSPRRWRATLMKVLDGAPLRKQERTKGKLLKKALANPTIFNQAKRIQQLVEQSKRANANIYKAPTIPSLNYQNKTTPSREYPPGYRAFEKSMIERKYSTLPIAQKKAKKATTPEEKMQKLREQFSQLEINPTSQDIAMVFMRVLLRKALGNIPIPPHQREMVEHLRTILNEEKMKKKAHHILREADQDRTQKKNKTTLTVAPNRRNTTRKPRRRGK